MICYLHYKMNDFIPMENELSEEVDEEDEYEYLMERINDMYDDVIMKFQSGQGIIFNPTIIRYMTRKNFFKWIIDNNDYVANVLQSK
jgi:hypothetical protein